MSRKRLIILLAAVSAVLLVLSNIPLIYGFLHHVPGRRFMGIVAGVRDSNFYFMMMQQADSLRFFLQNKFAPGEPNVIYHGFFWIPLGIIGRLFSGGYLWIYHLARAAATILFVPVAWYFVSRFFEEGNRWKLAPKIAALLIICFGAGAGWIPMLGYFRTGVMSFVPADIATPEASSFYTLLTFPHLALALILIALSFALLQESVSKGAVTPAIAAGLCGFVLGFIHVVNLVVIFAVLAAYAGISLLFQRQKMPARATIAFAAISIWPVAYYVYLSLMHPDLLPQVPVRSPSPLAYLAGFAPLLILSSFYVIKTILQKRLANGDLLLLCWISVNALMLYSNPLLKQEARAVLGLQLPLAVLAARGIFEGVLPALGIYDAEAGVQQKKTVGAAVAIFLVIFTFPSSICNMFDRVERVKAHPEAFSLADDEYEALIFLRNQSGGGVVLSGDIIGNYIPRMTGKCSWLGQYDLPSHTSRLQSARLFFSGILPKQEAEKFLRDNDIEFIYYGREEGAMGHFQAAQALNLEEVFHKGAVAVYRYGGAPASGADQHL